MRRPMSASGLFQLFCFIVFSTPSEAQNAVKLDKQIFKNRPLSIEISKKGNGYNIEYHFFLLFLGRNQTLQLLPTNLLPNLKIAKKFL